MSNINISQSTYKVLIRVDASKEIGTGHFMRCLSIAEELLKLEAEIIFLCEKIPSNYVNLLNLKKIKHIKINNIKSILKKKGELSHSWWLSVTQQEDAIACQSQLNGREFDLLIVDNYALDYRWERLMRPLTKTIFVIDDLADRKHDCDILLDQNYFVNGAARYKKLVPKKCKLLLGPKFAIIRKEFRLFRKNIDEMTGVIKKVYIFLGGIDKNNLTLKIIKSILSLNNINLSLDIVVTSQNPNLKKIEMYCLPRGLSLFKDPKDIAKLMSKSDLAIGAGGASSWERCCIGLPSIVFSIADNQKLIVNNLRKKKVIMNMGDAANYNEILFLNCIEKLILKPKKIIKMSQSAQKLVDGYGMDRVLKKLTNV